MSILVDLSYCRGSAHCVLRPSATWHGECGASDGGRWQRLFLYDRAPYSSWSAAHSVPLWSGRHLQLSRARPWLPRGNGEIRRIGHFAW